VNVHLVHLVRHGQTAWHADNRYTGRSDLDLDPTGVKQAEALAEWAAGAGYTALACSPLRRAVQTAEPVAAATGLTPLIDPRLRELDFGMAEGLTLAEVPADVAERFLADPAANPFPGGEYPADAVDRALEALRSLAGRTLVIGHSTLIRLVVCAVLGVPLGEYRRRLPRLANCARTELQFTGESVGLLAYNVPSTPGCSA
jgi:probable phosphoglycerate mutase